MKSILAILMIFTLAGCASKQSNMDKVPVTDMHSDIILRVIDNGVDIGNPPAWPQTALPMLEEGGVTNQVFAIWVHSGRMKETVATHRALQMIDVFYDQVERYPDRVQLATTVKEARAINAEGKIAAWLIIEGGAPISDDLKVLRNFHRLGVRGMTLTWFNNLLWAGSSTDKEDGGMGLTDFGREVVQEMNRIGMVVDLSHVSEATFYDALEESTDPVIASHSACYALSPHPRNLTDDQLRALAKNGGVVGINALPSYLDIDFDPVWEATEESIMDQINVLKEKYDNNTSNPEYREERRVLIQSNLPEDSKVTLSDYVDHIEHAIEIAGWQHVGLGADFDGIWTFPEGFEKASKWQVVTQELRNRGYSEEVIRGIMSENALRVFEQVIDQ